MTGIYVTFGIVVLIWFIMIRSSGAYGLYSPFNRFFMAGGRHRFWSDPKMRFDDAEPGQIGYINNVNTRQLWPVSTFKALFATEGYGGIANGVNEFICFLSLLFAGICGLMYTVYSMVEITTLMQIYGFWETLAEVVTTALFTDDTLTASGFAVWAAIVALSLTVFQIVCELLDVFILVRRVQAGSDEFSKFRALFLEVKNDTADIANWVKSGRCCDKDSAIRGIGLAVLSRHSQTYPSFVEMTCDKDEEGMSIEVKLKWKPLISALVVAVVLAPAIIASVLVNILQISLHHIKLSAKVRPRGFLWKTKIKDES